MKAKHIDLSLLLPKTGQIISYAAGDDGQYESGWWQGLLNADNRIRFIIKLIESGYVTIDLATGLMWACDGSQDGCNQNNLLSWSSAITYANALDFAGFTDWRIPNIKELLSIVDFSRSIPAVDESFFVDTENEVYWSSTTYKNITTMAWGVDFADGDLEVLIKLSAYRLRCVRGGL